MRNKSWIWLHQRAWD